MADDGKISKDEANYRESSGKQRCGNCGMYRRRAPDTGLCTLVKGPIHKDDTCDYWRSENA